MPGLVPGIHVFAVGAEKDVDGRDEPGHDGVKSYLIASGLTGEPTPPVIGIAGAANRYS
jgi:hypothetical protein